MAVGCRCVDRGGERWSTDTYIEGRLHSPREYEWRGVRVWDQPGLGLITAQPLSVRHLRQKACAHDTPQHHSNTTHNTTHNTASRTLPNTAQHCTHYTAPTVAIRSNSQWFASLSRWSSIGRERLLQQTQCEGRIIAHAYVYVLQDCMFS